MVKVIFCSLLIAVGCGGGGGGTSTPDAGSIPDGSGPGPDATPPSMDVHGAATLHFVTDTGVTDAPRDFSSAVFSSYTPDGDGFDLRSGVGAADGTFTVPVGEGASTWDLGFVPFSGIAPEYLVGGTLTYDFSSYVLGRLDREFPMASTPVVIEAAGLAPWGALDDLEIFVSNAGAIVFSPQVDFTAPITAGSTTIPAQTIDWLSQFNPLVDAAKGDTTVMFQLATQTSGTDSYAAIAKLGTATGFTQSDGQSSNLTVSMADVPQDETLTVHWKRSQFAALADQAGPGAVPGASLLAVDALPDANTRGFFASAPDLVEFLQPPGGTTDLDETFTYGNPFSTGGTPWDEFVLVEGEFSVPVRAGTTTPATVDAGYYAQVPVGALQTDGTIAPKLSGVSNIRVGGKEVSTAAQSGVGLTPLVAWDAPAIGTPTSYQVTIDAVTAANGATELRTVAYFETADTSLQLPSDMLTAGTKFVAIITAFATPGADLTTTPFEFGGDYTQFATVTAQFEP
jgi:hypothetical protein